MIILNTTVLDLLALLLRFSLALLAAELECELLRSPSPVDVFCRRRALGGAELCLGRSRWTGVVWVVTCMDIRLFPASELIFLFFVSQVSLIIYISIFLISSCTKYSSVTIVNSYEIFSVVFFSPMSKIFDVIMIFNVPYASDFNMVIATLASKSFSSEEPHFHLSRYTCRTSPPSSIHLLLVCT